MKNVLKELENLDLSLAVICIFLPGGGVLYINKQEGLDYHIEYFQELYKNNLFVREILANVDFDYYRHNPTEVYNEIVPLFQLSGCSVYLNMAPNTMYPTNLAMFYLADNPSIEQCEIINSIQDKFEEIEFFDIAKFDIESGENKPSLSDSDYGQLNARALYAILEDFEENNNFKK